MVSEVDLHRIVILTSITNYQPSQQHGQSLLACLHHITRITGGRSVSWSEHAHALLEFVDGEGHQLLEVDFDEFEVVLVGMFVIALIAFLRFLVIVFNGKFVG